MSLCRKVKSTLLMNYKEHSAVSVQSETEIDCPLKDDGAIGKSWL